MLKSWPAPALCPELCLVAASDGLFPESGPSAEEPDRQTVQGDYQGQNQPTHEVSSCRRAPSIALNPARQIYEAPALPRLPLSTRGAEQRRPGKNANNVMLSACQLLEVYRSIPAEAHSRGRPQQATVSVTHWSTAPQPSRRRLSGGPSVNPGN
jgi:hypothetical protein